MAAARRDMSITPRLKKSPKNQRGWNSRHLGGISFCSGKTYASAMFKPHIDRWHLTEDGDPIITRSGRLLPVLWQGKPAMLKLSDDDAERAGAQLLRWWNGAGAAKVYRLDAEAVLLERATGSRSLLAMAADGHDDAASRIICATVAKLHAKRDITPPPVIPLARWFRALTPAASTHGDTFAACHAIAAALLADPRDQTVLHGDIHHRNILDFEGRGWLAIDPKGLVGERGYDHANTFANPELAIATTQERLQRQLSIVAEAAGLDKRRLLQWIAAYCGLSAAWFVEDGLVREAETPLTIAGIAIAELAAR